MDNNNLYTMKEFCDYLGIGRNTALSLIHEEKLKALKVGRHWLVPKEEVDNYIKNELKRQNRKTLQRKELKTMTKLNKFMLTASMDKKTLQKVEKIFAKFDCLDKNYSETEFPDNEEPNTESPFGNSVEITIYNEGENPAVEIYVDIEGLSKVKNIPDLPNPTLDNAGSIIEFVRKKYGELEKALPFDRFYLAELVYTSYVDFPNEEMAGEYIRLLNESILGPDIIGIDKERYLTHSRIHDAADKRNASMSFSYELSGCYDVTFFRQAPDDFTEESELVVEVWEYSVKSIERKLISASKHNKPLAEQLAFFMMCYMEYTVDKLRPLFSKRPYVKQDAMLKSVRNVMLKEKISKPARRAMLQIIESIPEGNIYAWFENKGMLDDGKTDFPWFGLIMKRVQLAFISDDFDDTDELPDICTLLEHGL